MAYVIESSYKPFSFQELATPYMLYKDAYDKQEANLEALYDKASAFSDLEDLPEDSKARKIYDNYMNTLNAANKDFASNGLTMSNRGMYNDIRKRYQGEIGRLAQAKTKVEDINKQRMALRMQGKGMIYSKDNIDIDDMLGKDKPNMFGISTDYLYSLGSKAGAASSSRIWSNPEIKSTANKWFLLSSQANGYSPEMLAKMRDDFMAIPEFKKQVENAMKANGVTDNLTGDKYTQAVLNYANGFIDSCTYKRNDSFQHDPSIEFNERVREFNVNKDMQEKQFNAQLQTKGFVSDDGGNTYHYDSTKDPELQKAVEVAKAKAQNKSNTLRSAYLQKPIVITWTDEDHSSTSEIPYTTEIVDGTTIKTRKYKGSHQAWDDIKAYWLQQNIFDKWLTAVPEIVKKHPEGYDFYYTGHGPGEALSIVPLGIRIGQSMTNVPGLEEAFDTSSFASLH